MKLLCMLLLCCVSLCAECIPQYIARYSYTSGGAITIQQLASGSKTVELCSGFVYCASACTATEEVSGTAATATAMAAESASATASLLILLRAASLGGGPVASVFKDSNSSSGKVLMPYILVAGEKLPLSLEGIGLLGNGTTVNFTLRSSTGTGELSVSWKERR